MDQIVEGSNSVVAKDGDKSFFILFSDQQILEAKLRSLLDQPKINLVLVIHEDYLLGSEKPSFGFSNGDDVKLGNFVSDPQKI